MSGSLAPLLLAILCHHTFSLSLAPEISSVKSISHKILSATLRKPDFASQDLSQYRNSYLQLALQ
jgi:hypothetical protein